MCERVVGVSIVEACRWGITLPGGLEGAGVGGGHYDHRHLGLEGWVWMGWGLATLTIRLCSCRNLSNNQLTSLPSGIFDQLTALTDL